MSTETKNEPILRMNPLRGLPIGWPVLFYVTGDRSHLPAPAVVFRNHGNGVLDMCEFRWGADQKQRGGVRHVDDPWLAQNEQFRQRNGGWDYVPGLVLPDDLPIFPSGVNPTQEEVVVITMAAQGASRGDISNATGIPPKKVAELIDRFQNCLP